MKSAVILSACIIATALVAMMGLHLYFSPYHSCVRTLLAADHEPADAALACLHGVEADDDTEPAVGGFRTRQASTARSASNARPGDRAEQAERRPLEQAGNPRTKRAHRAG